MADKNDESVGETTLVRNILEDLDTFVGGKKRGLNENNKPEARADNLKSTNSTTSSASNENKQYQANSSAQLDLIGSRARIIQLETELHSIERDCKRARYEQELELITNYPTSLKLELELNDLKQKYQTAKDKSDESERAKKCIENEWKQFNSGWKRERLQLQSELTEVKHALRATTSKLDFLQQQKEIETKIQELKYSELEQKYEEQLELSEKASVRIKEELDPAIASLEASEDQNKKLKREFEQREDESKIFACVKDKLPNLIKAEKKYIQLQGDNEVLIDRCRDFEIMREKAIEFEAKYNRSESRLKEFASLRTENSQLKQALQKWEKFDTAAISQMGFGSPDTLIRKYCDMQQQLVLLTERSGDLQTSLTIAETKLETVSRELVETKAELALEKTNSRIKNEQCQKLERKLVYIKMDRDSYPKLIKSYDKASSSRSSVDEHLKVRVEQSEHNLARAQERVRELEEELESVQNISNTNVIDLTESNSHISKLSLQLETNAKTIARLNRKTEWQEQQSTERQKENRNLQQQINEKTQELKSQTSLETKSTEEPTRQVWVHLKQNSLSHARERKLRELLHLRREVTELRVAIEKGEYSSGDLVHKKEISKLKEKLNNADVMENRLKESFSKRITEFREVCNMLTGYRIDAQPGGRYKIRSIYAENVDDYLEFLMSQGNLSLLPTAYSDTIKSKITLYLDQHSSLPCLTSDITMELFKKCTLFL